MPIKPEHLNSGDLVGIVAPASPPPNPKSIDACVQAAEQLGFRVRLGRNTRKRLGFLAGSDRERAGDLMEMFVDREVRAIFCLRGGYGANRLLPLLDFKTIQLNPKVFVGFSDITALHCAFLMKANLVSFHGPMLHSHFIKGDLPRFTKESFQRTLMHNTAPGHVCQGYRKKTVGVLRPGIGCGRLLGGNLSLLCASLGTRHQPSFAGKILFLEDVDEAPYRFDRMLTQLLQAGLLQKVAGIAIGVNVHCKDPKARTCQEYRQTLEDVFRDRLLPLKVPVVVGLPFGHCAHSACIPVGVRARLDAERGDLEILEPAVR